MKNFKRIDELQAFFYLHNFVRKKVIMQILRIFLKESHKTTVNTISSFFK
jgi:hypothetical protein